jgi:hypothetical protein
MLPSMTTHNEHHQKYCSTLLWIFQWICDCKRYCELFNSSVNFPLSHAATAILVCYSSISSVAFTSFDKNHHIPHSCSSEHSVKGSAIGRSESSTLFIFAIIFSFVNSILLVNQNLLLLYYFLP